MKVIINNETVNLPDNNATVQRLLEYCTATNSDLSEVLTMTIREFLEKESEV